jgi:hypothetical protein
MTLTPTDEEPMRSERVLGYAIKMTCGDKIVPVRITDDALRAIASPPDDSPKTLRQYRVLLEEIASRKHSAGQVETDGSVCVTSADV